MWARATSCPTTARSPPDGVEGERVGRDVDDLTARERDRPQHVLHAALDLGHAQPARRGANHAAILVDRELRRRRALQAWADDELALVAVGDLGALLPHVAPDHVLVDALRH